MQTTDIEARSTMAWSREMSRSIVPASDNTRDVPDSTERYFHHTVRNMFFRDEYIRYLTVKTIEWYHVIRDLESRNCVVSDSISATVQFQIHCLSEHPFVTRDHVVVLSGFLACDGTVLNQAAEAAIDKVLHRIERSVHPSVSTVTTGMVLRREGSCVIVCFAHPHEHVGMVERAFDSALLSPDAAHGDTFLLRVELDRDGNTLEYRIPTTIFDSELHKIRQNLIKAQASCDLLPKRPPTVRNFDDPEEIRRHEDVLGDTVRRLFEQGGSATY